MNKLITTLVLFSVLIASFSFQSDYTLKYFYEPDSCDLKGTLVLKKFYGHPGYGENPTKDKIEHVYVIILNKPIDVYSKNKSDEINVPEKNVSKIQLFLNMELYKSLNISHLDSKTGSY